MTETGRSRVGFIGAGTVGRALSARLAAAGWPVVAVASRSVESARALARSVPGCAAWADAQAVADAADLVFITTPDGAVREVAAAVRWRAGQRAVHTSGALSVRDLAPAREQGAEVGSLHPLQSFADAEEAARLLTGSFFAVEGSGGLREELIRMAEALGGTWAVLEPHEKTLYHAAAVLASNYTVVLMDLAAGLWERFGATREEAVAALLPLLRGTAHNLGRVGLPAALTGPVARGDVETVRRHVEALGRTAPDVLKVYEALGHEAIRVARAKGTIDERQAAELRGALDRTARQLRHMVRL